MAVSTTMPDRSADRPAAEQVVCPACARAIEPGARAWRLRLCPACGHHFTMGAPERIASLVDAGSFREINAALVSTDPLTFADTRSYAERLAEAQEKTGQAEAVTTGTALIGGRPCVLIVLDFNFLGGSMGTVVGEKAASTPASPPRPTSSWPSRAR
jgi:acyl-CoA carboxylase subunit beta